MDQNLIVIKLRESIDMGVSNSSFEKKVYALSELTEDANILVSESWGQPNAADANDVVHIKYEMKDIHLTDEKMEFTFYRYHYTLNRQWQVLGTGLYGVPNAYIHITERFIFYFGTESIDGDTLHDELQELYNEMADNADNGKYWKNIPLARHSLQLMKDSNLENENVVCHSLCELVVKEKLLDELDTPRLILSFMEFEHAMYGSGYKWEQESYDLRCITGPRATEKEIEDYINENSHLKYDPIQLSQQWEDNIYEVEKELDEQFKDKARHMGFCHRYWSAKKDALAKRGIDWRSPQTMNPKTKFD